MNSFTNICTAIWNCIKGIAGGLWSIVKGMFKIVGTIIDFLATVLDELMNLVAEGIASIILLFIPPEDEIKENTNPLVSGIQDMIDSGAIDLDNGISIDDLKKKGAYFGVGVTNADKKVMGEETIKSFYDAGDNSVANQKVRNGCRERGYVVIKKNC